MVPLQPLQLLQLLQLNLILRPHRIGKHIIPERRCITHGSEAEGKKKMQLNMKHIMVMQS